MIESTVARMSKKSTEEHATRKRPVEIEMPPRDYQPSVAELREEFDMPGASMKQVRQAFFRPVRIVEKPTKSGRRVKR